MNIVRQSLALIASVALAVTARAGQYGETFQSYAEGTTSLPASVGELYSTHLGSVAQVTGAGQKELALTASGTGRTRSAFRLPDLDSGQRVWAFSAKWNSQVYGDFPNAAADGFSFNFGALGSLTGANLTDAGYSQEDGYNVGLTVGVRTFTGNTPGFYVRVNGTTVSGGFSSQPAANWGGFSGTRHLFEVDWRYDTGLTLKMDGTNIFSNLATPGFTPQVGDRFVWAARTGGLAQEVRLDNVVVVTGGTLTPLATGAPFYSLGENLPNEGRARAFDGNSATKWLSFSALPEHLGATLTNGADTVRAYTLTSANDSPDRDPKTWNFQTSPDGTSWTTRSSATNEGWLNRFEPRAFLVSAAAADSKFRVNITVNNGAGNLQQLAEFRPWKFSAYTVPAAAVTTPASAQSNTVATLNGNVNPNGNATTAWFEWGAGLATNFSQQTAPVSVGSGSSPVAISNTLSGLTPGIVYQGRAVGSNVWGVIRGSTVSFGSPALALNGAAVVTNLFGQSFTDPGATANGGVLAIAGGGFHSLALRSDGTVAAWGRNDFGQTNVPAGLSNVVAIAGGVYHSLALRSDGTVAAWGWNNYGQANVPAGLGNLSVSISGSVNTNVPGTYTLTYTATNSFGGVNSITRTVVVLPTPPAPVIGNPVRLGNGAVQFNFASTPNAGFTVLASTNVALPVNAWSNLGPAVETPAASGQFQFTDPQATNHPSRFYLIRSP